jgi:hypothetical protein
MQAGSETIMKNCMATETYDGCPLKKCRACAAKKDCDKETWLSMGGK